MKILSKILALAALGAIALPGTAQVYESKDDKGHPVYSDQPSDGSTVVEIKPDTAPERGSEEYQRKLDREMEAYRREQDELERERHGVKRREEGDDTDMRRHEVGDDADMRRHEVGDDDDMRRREVGSGTDREKQ